MSQVQDEEMEALSPVMSYEPGNDHLELVESEGGEPKYEGKGKGRSESFSHLPNTVPSEPSTAPSTRPNSEIPGASAPSTAPSTRPTSETPGTGQVESAAMATQGDPGPSTGQAESASATGQGDPGPSTDQAESASATGQGDEVPTKSISVRQECGCRDIYDDTGKKRQQACQKHKLDPNRSILPLPPKKSLSESTNMSAEQRILSVRAPRATRNEESPPRQPPVVTPFKGRNFVQASETGPAFLDPFNSEPAIEPTGPPNSLTTIPTAKDKPVKKRSTGQVSIAKESGPKAVGPKVTDPVTPQTPSNPPQLDEGPKKLDAVEGQDLGSDISKGEQPTEEKATIEPRRVELGGTDEFPDTRDSDQDNRAFPTISPVAPLNSPHHRHDITPKSILKKTVGTAAEARQAEEGGMSSWEQIGPYGVPAAKDPSGGPKLFRGTLANWKAVNMSKKAEADAAKRAEEDAVSRLNTETESGAGTPRLNMELNAISGGDSSDDESAERARKYCLPRCNLL